MSTHILITGASRGIGAAIAEALTTDATKVVALSSADGDLADPATPGRIWNRALAHLDGRIDVLINNVGGTIWARPFAEYQPDQIEKEIRRSLFPTLWGCRAALPWMLKQGKGSIVNISSVATAGVNRVPYSAAKGGVNALTRSIAMEYSGSGIRINAVAPGGTEAPPRLTPRNEEQPSEQEKAWYQQVVDQTVASSLLHRYGTLAEQANAILFLASDEASYITGVTLPVAGGDLG